MVFIGTKFINSITIRIASIADRLFRLQRLRLHCNKWTSRFSPLQIGRLPYGTPIPTAQGCWWFHVLVGAVTVIIETICTISVGAGFHCRFVHPHTTTPMLQVDPPHQRWPVSTKFSSIFSRSHCQIRTIRPFQTAVTLQIYAPVKISFGLSRSRQTKLPFSTCPHSDRQLLSIPVSGKSSSTRSSQSSSSPSHSSMPWESVWLQMISPERHTFVPPEQTPNRPVSQLSP